MRPIKTVKTRQKKRQKYFLLILGDCVGFDNTRVLHGRKGYVATAESHRFLNGCYLSWDEIRSRMNVIKHMKYEKEPH